MGLNDLRWEESYLTFLGWGIGTKHQYQELTYVVESYGTDGLYIYALCSIEEYPRMQQKTVKFPYPEPIYPASIF